MEVLLTYSNSILTAIWLLKLKFLIASLVSHTKSSPAQTYAQLVEATDENQPRLFCPDKMTLVISLAPIRSLRNCTALSQMKHLSFTVASATNKSTASRIFLLA